MFNEWSYNEGLGESKASILARGCVKVRRGVFKCPDGSEVTPTEEPISGGGATMCDYAPAPAGCTYEHGPRYDPETGCGLVLKCPPKPTEVPGAGGTDCHGIWPNIPTGQNIAGCCIDPCTSELYSAPFRADGHCTREIPPGGCPAGSTPPTGGATPGAGAAPGPPSAGTGTAADADAGGGVMSFLQQSWLGIPAWVYVGAAALLLSKPGGRR